MKEVVHVPTRELAEEVLRVAKENGFNTIPLDRDIRGNDYKYKLCLELKKDPSTSLFGGIEFFEEVGYKIITAKEFLDRYKPKFRPIAMKCNQEQFDAVRSKLVGLKVRYLSKFDDCPYLVNNISGAKGIISNVPDLDKSECNREVFEEWNEKTFLEYCGIAVKDKLLPKENIEYFKERISELEIDINNLNITQSDLLRENEYLKKQLKEIQDQPKVGDVCIFWDNGNKGGSLGVLVTIDKNRAFPYEHHDQSEYEQCVKATDENIQAKINELKNNY